MMNQIKFKKINLYVKCFIKLNLFNYIIWIAQHMEDNFKHKR